MSLTEFRRMVSRSKSELDIRSTRTDCNFWLQAVEPEQVQGPVQEQLQAQGSKRHRSSDPGRYGGTIRVLAVQTVQAHQRRI